MKECEICQNKEIRYLPYPIENEIYINITCFFCKKEIFICSLCTKYYYRKDRDDEYLIIPDEYQDISYNLSKDPPQCRKCIKMSVGCVDKYKFCNMCTEYLNNADFIECDKCFMESCKECNKNNICSICERNIIII